MKYQVAIIGGGPAGYTAAEMAGKAGLKVVLFEKNNLGGVCLNEGCIPTKALLYSAKVLDTAKHASKYAVSISQPSFDLGKMVARKSKVVRKLVLGIKARLAAQQVTVVQGEAFIVDSHTVCCGGDMYECENLLLCTGSDSVVPPIEGLKDIPFWTHRNALENKELPHSLTVIGGGVIGMEFTSFFNSLGVSVTVIEMQSEILGGIDGELAAMLRGEYEKRGVRFLRNTRVVLVKQADGVIKVLCDSSGDIIEVESERLLLSVGRRPVTEGFGLENLNLERSVRNCIKTDEHLLTSVPGVYACGDLNGVSLLAHTAVREAEVAVHHILGKTDAMDYRAVPGVVYTNPEVASVGSTEEALRDAGVSYQAIRVPMAFSGRFVAENEGKNGLCKALVGGDGTLLGLHMLGNPSSELIVLGEMMIADRRKYSEWKRYVFPHPTVGEVLREL